MKKFLLLFVLSLSALLVFAGCASTTERPNRGPKDKTNQQSIADGGDKNSLTESVNNSHSQSNSDKNTANNIQPNPNDIITAESAKEIAFNHAGVKQSDIRDLDVELDRDGGVLHYNVDFEVGNKDYDYEIDAKTGKILHLEKERD